MTTHEPHETDEPNEDLALEVWGDAHTGGPVAISVAGQMLQTNGKKATHSFFRQLVEADLIDRESAELLGTPMAVVNWHPDGCAYPKARLSLARNMPHVHILWRTPNGTWLRALVSQLQHVDFWMRRASGFTRRFALLQAAADHLLAARVLDGWRPDWVRRHVPTWRLTREAHHLEVGLVAGQQDTPTMQFHWDSWDISCQTSDAICRLWHPDIARTLHPESGYQRFANGGDGSEWPTDDAFAAEQEQCRMELRRVCAGRPVPDILVTEVEPALADLHLFRARWFASHERVFQVQQVFL